MGRISQLARGDKLQTRAFRSNCRTRNCPTPPVWVEVLRFAQDFGSGLRRPLDASISTRAFALAQHDTDGVIVADSNLLSCYSAGAPHLAALSGSCFATDHRRPNVGMSIGWIESGTSPHLPATQVAYELMHSLRRENVGHPRLEITPALARVTACRTLLSCPRPPYLEDGQL